MMKSMKIIYRFLVKQNDLFLGNYSHTYLSSDSDDAVPFFAFAALEFLESLKIFAHVTDINHDIGKHLIQVSYLLRCIFLSYYLIFGIQFLQYPF